MKKFLALLISIAILVSSLAVYALAVDVKIDLGDLWDDEEDVSDDTNTGTDDSADDNAAGDSDNKTDDSENKTDDSENKTDDKPVNNKPVTVKPSGNKDTSDKNKDEKKEEEPKVYNTKFTDVTEDKWFYSYVTDLASKGIINGYDDDNDGVFEFKPQNNITRAEFLKLLVECMGYSQSATPVFDDVTENKWYYAVVSTAAKNGIVSVEEYGKNLKPDEVITRAEVAKLIVRATKAEVGKYKTPYVDADDEYITALYAICLMQGSKDDATGDRYFKADSNITRAETSTVFSRLLEYNANPEEFVKAKTEEYKMPALELVENVNYLNDIKDIGNNPMSFFSVMLSNSSSLNHNDYSENLKSEFSRCINIYPELFTFTDIEIKKTDITDGVRIDISLIGTSENYTIDELYGMRKKVNEKAKSIVQGLFSGKELSKKQKVEKIYDYICNNVEYAKEEEDAYYTAYGALLRGRAFCQGYASAFNLLCKSAGIESVGVATDNHIFNAVRVEEGILYCDVTYEDSYSEREYQKNDEKINLCCISLEQMQKLHGNFDVPLEIYFTLE